MDTSNDKRENNKIASAKYYEANKDLINKKLKEKRASNRLAKPVKIVLTKKEINKKYYDSRRAKVVQKEDNNTVRIVFYNQAMPSYKTFVFDSKNRVSAGAMARRIKKSGSHLYPDMLEYIDSHGGFMNYDIRYETK